MAKHKRQGAEATPVIPQEPEQQPDNEGGKFSPITRDEPSASYYDD